MSFSTNKTSNSDRDFPLVSIVVAAGDNGIIGHNNKLPWFLPNDLKYFKELTWDNVVVMGRRTYESIEKPLPGRVNVIMTSKEITGENVIAMPGIKAFGDLLRKQADNGEWLEKEIFVIGGEQIFDLFLPYTHKIYLTRINETFVGDTFFPLPDSEQWNIVSKVKGEKNSENPYDYFFCVYERVAEPKSILNGECK